MLPRLYLVAGVSLLLGYAVSEFNGWEFGRSIVITPAPPVGTSLAARSSWGSGYSSGSSSTYRGSPVYTGPTGGK